MLGFTIIDEGSVFGYENWKGRKVEFQGNILGHIIYIKNALISKVEEHEDGKVYVSLSFDEFTIIGDKK